MIALAPSVEQAIVFVDEAKSMDEVAAKLAYLRSVESDLADAIGVLRRHVMTAIGEPQTGNGAPSPFDVPF